MFFVRSFPILIASFVLGPGIAWLLGMSHGVLDVTTNPPRYRRAYHSMLLCVGVGMFILSCAGMFVMALAKVLLPLQRALGNAEAGMSAGGGSISTGDGTASVVLPFSLTYGEMLKAPWYFLVPYASIVFGSLLLAVLAWPAAIVHQLWSWWHFRAGGGNVDTVRVRAYQVDDIKAQLKDRRKTIGRLHKAGVDEKLVASLAAQAEAAAAQAQANKQAGPVPDSDGDAPAGAAVRPNRAGAGRRGAVTLKL